MSWGTYDQGPSNPEGRPRRDDPWGRTYEPPGYVAHDPFATPNYNHQNSNPYGPPQAYPGVLQFSYDPAHPPRPNVGPMQALTLFFKNYAVFHGRASRAEYWWMWLWSAIATVVFTIGVVIAVAIDSATGAPALTGIVVVLLVILSLGVLVPSLSLQVRRLHDAEFSGFFSLFGYIPYLNYVTWLVPFIMSFFPSNPHGIKFDNPNGTQPAMH